MAASVRPFLGVTVTSSEYNSVAANVSVGISLPFQRAIFSRIPGSGVTVQVDSLVSQRGVKVYQIATGYTERIGKTFRSSVGVTFGLGDQKGKTAFSLGIQGEYPCPVKLAWIHTR